MRELMALTAAALAVGIVAVAPTGAQNPSQTELTVQAKVSPNRAGTPRKPQGVKLNVKTHWETPPGFERPVIERAKAFFPGGSLYRGGSYPRCSQNTLERKGLAGCPKRSIMGSGEAVAFADTVLTRPKITVVNGGAKRVYLYTVMNNPARVQAPVPGIIRKRSGKWRYELELIVPRVLQIVAGVPIALRDFEVTAGRGTWLATTGCPRSRRWAFKVETFYSTGGSDSFKDSVRCRR